MDIGIYTRSEVLEEKLKARSEQNTEQVWNLRSWPHRFNEAGENRLFVATAGAWRGYFRLSREALYNPFDPAAPFSLLFDTCSWREIDPVPVKQFRGFTYKVPQMSHAPTQAAT